MAKVIWYIFVTFFIQLLSQLISLQKAKHGLVLASSHVNLLEQSESVYIRKDNNFQSIGQGLQNIALLLLVW